ncbi:hypothetical protein MN116_008368 [Schistosoma mekongi]|uniref:DUF4709 domain-containing protein n=1 Tax=Schistosoma mekongi TaxID=38744 RepID=A0AAE1Z6V8_SCHME|nr:hypothetical protein MN116_008368 [Schistosoma mekongi]
MASINNKPSELKQSLLTNRIQDSMYIDYHLLADILPKPPELPIPKEPSFIPNELYNLTISNHYTMKLFVDSSSQTEISEIYNLNELKNKLNNLILLINDYPIQMNHIKNASNYEMKLLIDKILLNIYEIMKIRIDNLSKSYTMSIEQIRGACRTQLANTIAVLNGLINTVKQRDKTLIEVLKSALSAVQSQVRSLIDQRDQSEQKVNILTNQLNEIKENYTKLEKQLHDKDIELTTCKQKMISTESRLNEVLTSMNNLREENCKLEKDYACNRDNEMKQLKQQLDDLLKNKEILEHECNSLRIELGRLNQKSKVLEPITENTNNSALREQALIAEIIRLRRDLNRLQEASETRIRCLKNRLKAFTEETFKRNALETKVSQLHTAALKYANQFDQLTTSNKQNHGFTDNNEITRSNSTCRLYLPPVTLPALQNNISQQNTLELRVSLKSTRPSLVGID